MTNTKPATSPFPKPTLLAHSLWGVSSYKCRCQMNKASPEPTQMQRLSLTSKFFQVFLREEKDLSARPC